MGVLAGCATTPAELSVSEPAPTNAAERGYELVMLGKPKEALEVYDQAIEEAPNDLRLRVYRAKLHEDLGQVEASLEDWHVARELSPEDPTVLRGLARALEARGELEAALEIYCGASAIQETTRGHRDQAFVLSKLGRWEEALEHQARVVAAWPDSAAAKFELAAILQELEDYPGAIESYRAALELEPEHLEARFNLGSCLASMQEWSAARESFTALLSLTPQDPEVQLRLASIALETRAFEEALRQLDRLSEQLAEPARAENIEAGILASLEFHRGIALSGLGRTDEALEAFRRATDSDAQLVEAWLEIGLALESKEDPVGALAAFTRVVELDESHPHGWFGVGVTAIQQGDEERALAAFERSLELDPQFRAARENLIVMQLRLGRSMEALEGIDLLLALDEHDPWLFRQRARALTELGRHEQAAEAEARAQRLESKPRERD